MAYQNFNTYSKSDVKKPKVIVESVKSGIIYTPSWTNDHCNNMELKKSLFTRYYLNDAKLNSVFSMNEKELQETTETVMKVVNSLYGDSIAQQLGLTNDKILKYQTMLNNNSVNPEEALRKWNINDYMAMGNSYPYNCVFNLMENAPPLRLPDDRRVTTSEFGNFSRNTFLTKNTSYSINNIDKHDVVDKIGCCHHLNITKISKETQTTNTIPVSCREGEGPLVSLEVTTFANGKFAKINCSNKTNESSVQKTKLFFAFTEYQKLVNVLHRMAALRTDSMSLQMSTGITPNKCSGFFTLNNNSNRSINLTNKAAQASYQRNAENTFTMTKASNLIHENNFESMLLNQKYCMTTYTTSSARNSNNVFRSNLTDIYPGNGGNSGPSCSQICPKMRANFSNQKPKKSQVKSRGSSKENLQQNKVLVNKRAASNPSKNMCEHNRSVECKDLSFFMINMRKQNNFNVQQSRKKNAETKKNKNLKIQKNKFQSGSVQKKHILTTQNRNVQIIPLAPATTTTIKNGNQRTNKMKNYKDTKKSGTKEINENKPLENTMDVIDWIEENSDTLNTVTQFSKSVKEIKENLLKGINKNEKENNESGENKSLSQKPDTKKKYFNKKRVQTDEKINPDIEKEIKPLKENVMQLNDNTVQLFQKSTPEKDQIEILCKEADKNKNETEHKNPKEDLKNEITTGISNCQETISIEENWCIDSNKCNPIADKITTSSPEDDAKNQKNNVSAEGTVMLPNSSEEYNQKAYPYNLRKRKPVVYFYPSVFRRIVPNTENKKAKKPKNN